MNSAALVIGVNKTGGLATLSGAVAGAHAFAGWAHKQGMDVRLVTDEDKPVTLSILQDVIDDLLEPRNVQKLVIYFAGHGFLLSANLELWLLSKAPSRGQEAVNLRLSADHARFSGLEHVIFVSDACRSGGPTHQHRTVSGSAIFSPPTTFDFNGKVDIFYATRPGDVALEYKDADEAVANYKGLFTECMLKALKGPGSDVVTEKTEGEVTRWLIESEQLNLHLSNEVPIQAENISLKLSQNPVAITESRWPQFFGEIPFKSGGTRGGLPSAPALHAPAGVTAFTSRNQDQILNMANDDPLIASSVDNAEEQRFVHQANQISQAQARDHFETTTGFTVYGNASSATISHSRSADVFLENGRMHVRVDMDARDRCSLLIEFDEGFSTVLTPIYGFIGVIVVEDEQIVSVNYTPSANTALYQDEYEPRADRIEKRRAFAATAMRHGAFELPKEDRAGPGNYLRMMKRLDPTLGIYAAYAYQQAGRISDIRSVASYMLQDGFLPFDVMLLARKYDLHTEYAPFCPMLSQGWGMLEMHPSANEKLKDYRQGLLPSLWTMFDTPTTALIKQQLVDGVLP